MISARSMGDNMCEQYLARAIDVVDGEFIPGWFLVMATCDGSNVMKRGDYGLGQINDPDFVIPAILKPTKIGRAHV